MKTVNFTHLNLSINIFLCVNGIAFAIPVLPEVRKMAQMSSAEIMGRFTVAESPFTTKSL
jgi:hypothetical protein